MLVYKLVKLANYVHAAVYLCNVYSYVQRCTYVHNYRAAGSDVIYLKAGFLSGGKTTVCLYSIRRIFNSQA